MSKIFKASSVKMDIKNKFNVDVPEIKSFTGNNDIESYEYADVSEIPVINKDIIEEDINEENPDDIINDAREQADIIIEEAEEQARQYLEEVKNNFELEKAEEFENCRKEGYEDGYNEAMAKTEDMMNEAKQTLNEAISEKEKILESIEREVVNLVVSISQKLISDSLRINPKVVMYLIRQGLEQATVKGKIAIHVSVEDYDTVLKNKSEIVAMTDGNTEIEIIKDFSLNKGDCIIETPFGNIDCSLQQQFEELKENLYYIMKNG